LIYFIFRVDTYGISYVFTCLMIIGGAAAGVRILLEKGPSRDHILKIRKIPEKYPEIIFSQKTHGARRERREEPGGPHTPGSRPCMQRKEYSGHYSSFGHIDYIETHLL
jgi:hypothetical protein